MMCLMKVAKLDLVKYYENKNTNKFKNTPSNK